MYSKATIHAFIVIYVLFTTTGAVQGEAQKWSQKDLLQKLSLLGPLPKVHYSWGLQGQFLEDHNNPVMYQLARIAHALSVAGESVTESQIDNCVYNCAKVNMTKPEMRSSIAINYSPWHRKFRKDLPVTDRGPSYYEEIEQFEFRLKLIKEWIDKSNKKYGTDVNVTAILLDSERFYAHKDDEKWNEAMREAFDVIHKKAVQIYPDARIEWYGRGIVRADGVTFSKTSYFTGKEIMPTLSCSLYTLPEMEGMRETFRRTCKLADSYGIKQVTPWVALASGYKRGLVKKMYWTDDWDYDLIYSYITGAELNASRYATQKDRYPEYGRAKVIVFFPAPFNSHSPAWGKHFIAYVRGATGVDKLEDLGFDK